MTKNYEEPLYIDKVKDKTADESTIKEIKELLEEETFGVLATSAETQVHASLMCYLICEDYKRLILATPVGTVKYHQIINNPNISFLIDNRRKDFENFNKFSALTVTAKANEIKDIQEIEKFRELFITKHTFLEKFVNAPTTALILVDNINYCYIKNFQEVNIWIP